LAGNNTTISIAHRLSTIQRSDTIICIGSDGKVAETGTYKELSNKPEGAFRKLMEWQMNGGDQPKSRPSSPKITEEEELAHIAEEVDTETEGTEFMDEQGTANRGDDISKIEAVTERVQTKGR